MIMFAKIIVLVKLKQKKANIFIGARKSKVDKYTRGRYDMRILLDNHMPCDVCHSYVALIALYLPSDLLSSLALVVLVFTLFVTTKNK